MPPINDYIVNYQPRDYGGVDLRDCELDCSLGVSCEPLPPEILERLGQIPEPEIRHYPHNAALLREIGTRLLDRYAPSANGLTLDHFHLGCGSFDLLCSLNLLYANSQKTILGHAPQFTAYVDHAHCIGAHYLAYPLPKEKNYKLDAQEFAAMIRRERPHLVICENPNNPTGQILTHDEILTLIRAAGEVNAAIIFDEAYGDYQDSELHSAIGFIRPMEQAGVDVFVTRTFSKGYGMAGVRLGYVFGLVRAITQLKKLVTPFNCSGPARYLARSILMTYPRYAEYLSRRTREQNRWLYEKIHAMGKFRIAETSLDTPICTLYVDDSSVDFCRKWRRSVLLWFPAPPLKIWGSIWSA